MPTIRVDDEVWKYVNVRRDAGESMNDVLRRELNLDEPEIGEAIAELDVDSKKADALRAMWEFIREREETTPKKLKAEVYQDHPGTYGGSNADYWHGQLADLLEELPGIERPSQRKWVYVE